MDEISSILVLFVYIFDFSSLLLLWDHSNQNFTACGNYSDIAVSAVFSAVYYFIAHNYEVLTLGKLWAKG